VYVEGDKTIRLGVWLKSEKAGSASQRFNYRQTLGPGANHVVIPCDLIWQDARKALWGTIDRGAVTELGMFVSGLEKPTTLYVDGVRLGKETRKAAPTEVGEGAARFDGSVLLDFRNMGRTGRSSGFFVEVEIPLENGQVRKVKLSEPWVGKEESGKREEVRFWLSDKQLSGYKADGEIVARAWFLDTYETMTSVRTIRVSAGKTVYVKYSGEDF